MDPDDVKALVKDLLASFLDDDSDVEVEVVSGIRSALFEIKPKNRAACARIIGYHRERIESVENYLYFLGKAWKTQYSVHIIQPVN